MANWKRSSTTDQFTEFLRQELANGRWGSSMPGVHALSAEYQLNRKTVEGSLARLEAEGWLASQGAGKRRLITTPSNAKPPALRIGFLLYDQTHAGESYMVDLFHKLEEAGHTIVIAEKSMQDMKLDTRRIARHVTSTSVDAWMVIAGPRPVLEWFSKQAIPVMAMFGRRRGLPIAGVGPEKTPIIRQVIRELFSIGHTRISMIVRSERRLPSPGAPERAVLEEMESLGLQTGAFNLPNWDDTANGLNDCLAELFRVTPPTALIVDEAPFYVGALQFLSQHHLRVPQDVSIICCDPSPAFDFCPQEVSHVYWDPKPVIKGIVNWANGVAKGRSSHRQIAYKAKLHRGETIGPAPQESHYNQFR